MRCLNLKKTEKHNIKFWFTSTEVNGNFAIDFNSSLCPLIMKVARMIYTKPQGEFSVSSYPNSVCRCICEVQCGLFLNETIQCLDLILNHADALGCFFLLKRSQIAHFLWGSWRWQGKKSSQMFKFSKGFWKLHFWFWSCVCSMVWIMEEVDETVFFLIVLGFFSVIHFDKVPGNAPNICKHICMCFPLRFTEV